MLQDASLHNVCHHVFHHVVFHHVVGQRRRGPCEVLAEGVGFEPTRPF